MSSGARLTAAEVAARVGEGRERHSGAGWSVPCPAHDDHVPSLSISEGREGRVVFKCHRGCTFDEIVEAAGIDRRDLAPGEERAPKAEIKDIYQYVDENGELLFETVRFEPGFDGARRPSASALQMAMVAGSGA